VFGLDDHKIGVRFLAQAKSKPALDCKRSYTNGYPRIRLPERDAEHSHVLELYFHYATTVLSFSLNDRLFIE
jgi:hypothetical protein